MAQNCLKVKLFLQRIKTQQTFIRLKEQKTVKLGVKNNLILTQ